MFDKSYAAVTRHRMPLSTSIRPRSIGLVDNTWASSTFNDDELDVERQENESLTPPFEEEEGELDIDNIVVLSYSHNRHHDSSSSTSGNWGPAVMFVTVERKRINESRWNDLGLD